MIIFLLESSICKFCRVASVARLYDGKFDAALKIPRYEFAVPIVLAVRFPRFIEVRDEAFKLKFISFSETSPLRICIDCYIGFRNVTQFSKLS